MTRQTITVLLVVLNLGLLAALILGPATPPAKAQAMGGGSSYLMVTAEYQEHREAAWIIDLAQRRLAALRLEPGGGGSLELREVRGRDLARDFNRR